MSGQSTDIRLLEYIPSTPMYAKKKTGGQVSKSITSRMAFDILEQSQVTLDFSASLVAAPDDSFSLACSALYFSPESCQNVMLKPMNSTTEMPIIT